MSMRGEKWLAKRVAVSLAVSLNWTRGTPFNSRHTTKPEQAKLAQRYGDSLLDDPGGVACARPRGRAVEP